MKVIKNYIALVLSLGLFLTSCNQDDLTGLSTFVATVPTINTPALVMATEGDIVTLEIQLSEAQVVDVDYDFSVDASSTATEGEDFVINTESPVRVPAHNTSFTIEVEILSDFPPEGTETVVLNLARDTVPNRPLGTAQATINIDDLPGTDLEIILGWDAAYDVTVAVTGTAEYGGPFDLATGADIVDGSQTLTGCQFADFDFIIVNDEFDTFYGTLSAQTSACPEVMAFPGEGVITNGTETSDTFFIFSDLYLNWGSSEFSSAPFLLNVNAQFTKQNTLIGTWTQSDDNAYPSNTPGGLGSQDTWQPILLVGRLDGVWTIWEGADVVFTARQQQAMQELQYGPRIAKWYEE